MSSTATADVCTAARSKSHSVSTVSDCVADTSPCITMPHAACRTPVCNFTAFCARLRNFHIDSVLTATALFIFTHSTVIPSASPPPASQQSAPLIPPPCHTQSSPALTPAHSVLLPTTPIPVQVCPFVLLCRKGDTCPLVQVYIPACTAPIIESLCDVLPPSMPIQVMSAPVQFLLPPVQVFPTPPEHVQPSQPSPIDATLDTLAKTIVTLKCGVESLLGNLSSPGSCREQSEDMPSRPE